MGAADLCLSRREIAELCRTPQRARQAAFLRQNGIRHYLDAHGWPVVLRATVEGAQAAAPVAARPSRIARPSVRRHSGRGRCWQG